MMSFQFKGAIVLASLIAFSSTACQKYERNKMVSPSAPIAPVQSFAGKDPATILKSKYNSAMLICSLWVEHAKEFSAKTRPLATVTLDLLTAKDGPGVINLQGEVDDLSVVVKLSFGQLGVFDTTLFGDDGVTYQVKNSPYFRYDFELSEAQKSTGVAFDTYRNARGVTERFADISLDMTRTLGGDATPYVERASCTISTDLKPEFTNQFKPIQVQ